MARNISSVQARQGALLVIIEMTSMAFYTTRGTPLRADLIDDIVGDQRIGRAVLITPTG
ncbi:hypothetical protein [Streptomyces chartreusis]|uniref:hypothetical protein n=1 Tax=Streptomyces chartreusis TaxID=1969 RepID=UPI003864C205